MFITKLKVKWCDIRFQYYKDLKQEKIRKASNCLLKGDCLGYDKCMKICTHCSDKLVLITRKKEQLLMNV